MAFSQAFFRALLVLAFCITAPMRTFAQAEPTQGSATQADEGVAAPDLLPVSNQFATAETLPTANQASLELTETAHPTESFPQFFRNTIDSPYPYAFAFSSGLFDQAMRFPKEWTGSMALPKRTAARVAQGLLEDSVFHSAAAIAHQRMTYDRCQCTGAMARTKHATARAFVAVRNDGSLMPNWPLWLSKYSAAGFANAWYPASYTRRDLLIQATSAIGISAGLNVLREFAHFK